MADAFVRSFRRTSSRTAALGALAGSLVLAGFGLGGCATPSYPFAQPVADVTSPLAEELSKVNRADATYPSFVSMPEAPQDVRPATAWTRNVFDTLRTRRETQGMSVIYPQTLYGTEAFAKEERSKAEALPTHAEAAALSDKTAKFAKDQRDRAKAPSPAR